MATLADLAAETEKSLLVGESPSARRLAEIVTPEATATAQRLSQWAVLSTGMIAAERARRQFNTTAATILTSRMLEESVTSTIRMLGNVVWNPPPRIAAVADQVVHQQAALAARSSALTLNDRVHASLSTALKVSTPTVEAAARTAAATLHRALPQLVATLAPVPVVHLSPALQRALRQFDGLVERMAAVRDRLLDALVHEAVRQAQTEPHVIHLELSDQPWTCDWCLRPARWGHALVVGWDGLSLRPFLACRTCTN